MKDNKSPGSDGISAESYKIFWNDIKTMLIDSMISAYCTGELSASQKREYLV